MAKSSSQVVMPSLKRSPSWRFAGLFIGVLLLLICLVFSITLGAAEISPRAVWTALFAFDGSTDHLIVTTVRLPRTLSALMVGAALAVAGALMQGLTRNPLADPGLLGISAGAALAVVSTTFF